MAEHAVIIAFRYESTSLDRLFELEDFLQKAISGSGVGKYDGNEIAADGSAATLYMYGPDADRLFEVVVPILRARSFMKGARVKRRYGSAKSGANEITSTID
ncbi:hypothetical protein [Bradyrhizobium sp. C9]|uniref:hypothetical protein n=1 Tax=Bradyrhizobium sp. C9 TaxID=142585 RepID=UPI00130423C7|nr:hypothetical protein [Bradyrhizobium sp. C9]